MFIAHFPAGYLLASVGKTQVTRRHSKLAFWCILIGSVVPDLDMFYFYLVDNKQTHHHLYWPHLPIFWITFLSSTSLLSLLAKQIKGVRASLFLFIGAMLHLILDTPVGGIAWLFPLQKNLMHIVEVPAVRSWWVWNFILHWTFLIEILICISAIIVWIRKRKKISKVK